MESGCEMNRWGFVGKRICTLTPVCGLRTGAADGELIRRGGIIVVGGRVLAASV